ncbi:MAG: hypothetical protein IPN47_04355 [Gemmatimonadetes bacterium]|nr:hypothetical protein [Gemmatimonadota bacterium]
MSHSPGMTYRPAPSMRVVPAGIATRPVGPMAVMRPLAIKIVVPGRAAAPVPSISVTPTTASRAGASAR